MFLNDQEIARISNKLDDKNPDSGRAWRIAAFSGLRSAEVADLQFRDLFKGDRQHFVNVRDGKGGKSREAPIPERLAVEIQTIQQTQDKDDRDNVISVSMRTVRRHLSDITSQLSEDINQDYKHVSMHDARRSFIKRFLESDVPTALVMQYSGHDSYRVFRDHYLNKFSREREEEYIDRVDSY